MQPIITTTSKPSAAVIEKGQKYARLLNTPYIAREKQSIVTLQNRFPGAPLIIATNQCPLVYTATGKFFFHPNMAQLRRQSILNGKPDHMVQAMQLKAGMSVLDCTLGLATDAIVASFVTGVTGKVIALENSPIIALIVSEGLQYYPSADSQLNLAMQRIKVIQTNYYNYFVQIPAKSFDIVYFDPMFRKPIYDSSGLNSLRTLATSAELTTNTLLQAIRIAKQRVIVKETHGSEEFSRLGIRTLTGGKYSSIQYGIIEVA